MKSKLKKLVAASIFCGAALLVGVVVTPDAEAVKQGTCGSYTEGTVQDGTFECTGSALNCGVLVVCGDQPE